MAGSRLDVVYRRMVLSKFFTKGWGDPDHILKLLRFRKIVSNRESCFNLVQSDHHIKIFKRKIFSNRVVSQGEFTSPLSYHLPDVVPEAVSKAYFEVIVPRNWTTSHKPVCIHLAGTGDHYYWRRRKFMAEPLLQDGIGSIILENPFYGRRKPKDQMRSCLFHVSDIFVMGGCLILECIALLHWCERAGYGPLGITGLSMGGHMASLAATNWPKPLVLAPCLSWSTASSVFTEGVMSAAIDWDYLQNQYLSDTRYSDTLSKLCKIVDNPFAGGLAQIPEFGRLSRILSEKYRYDELCYITPHELLSVAKHVNYAVDASKSNETIVISLATLWRMLRTLTLSLSSSFQDIRVKDQEAVWFMRGLMDECTHLRNFDQPWDTSLIKAVSADYDAYVPKKGISNLQEIWPNASIKHLNCGHVSAYLFHMNVFREAILKGFQRAIQISDNPPPSS